MRVSMYSVSPPIFLSTLSLRRATHSARAIMKAHGFLSTLSLRRATICQERQSEFYAHFYPRSPCGERHGCIPGNVPIVQFLSTLSLRRATSKRAMSEIARVISIHALLAESDLGIVGCGGRLHGFLSTLSLRRATLAESQAGYPGKISIHALLAESDTSPESLFGGTWISIHALLAESDFPRQSQEK